MRPLPGELPLSPPGRLLWITDLDDIPVAFHLAVQYAVRLKAQLKLLHATPVGMTERSPLRPGAPAAEVLEKAASKARAEGVDCDWELSRAPLAISLRNLTEIWTPDRIFRVRRVTTAYEGLDSGTETVLREATVPVYVVSANRVPIVFRCPAKILFPTSLDRRSMEVASAVLRFAHAQGAEITMLHVIDGEAARSSWTNRVRACAVARFDEVLEELDGPAVTLIEVGRLSETVARVAQTHHHNLVLLSVSSGISFRGDIRPGSAYEILCKAPCPVLVCKHDVLPPMYGPERVAQTLVGPLHLPPA